jgi:hypothetical protein
MIKTIYILWFQGLREAPIIVQKCIDSWKRHNKGWNIVVLDNTNLHNYIDISSIKQVPSDITAYRGLIKTDEVSEEIVMTTALSDIVRIHLLKHYGGLWVDSTCFCTKPLDLWLPPLITQGFFAYNRPTPNRMVASWFLYGEKDNYIIDKWYHSVKQFWQTNRPNFVYFWFHHLFNDLYLTDPAIKEIWDRVPKISVGEAMSLFLADIASPLSSDIKAIIDSKAVPVFKLTYKCDMKKVYNKNSICSYLFK